MESSLGKLVKELGRSEISLGKLGKKSDRQENSHPILGILEERPKKEKEQEEIKGPHLIWVGKLGQFNHVRKVNQVY